MTTRGKKIENVDLGVVVKSIELCLAISPGTVIFAAVKTLNVSFLKSSGDLRILLKNHNPSHHPKEGV